MIKRIKCWWNGYHIYAVVEYLGFLDTTNVYECTRCGKVHKDKVKR